MADHVNPFDLVKASDLSDSQVAKYFVDFPGHKSLLDRVRPKSAMPMIIFGGKGSGKTHLMRYLSCPLQLAGGDEESPLLERVLSSGYLGMYFRCSGLNAQRFAGKGIDAERWQDVFAYYLELWIGEVYLQVLAGVLGGETPIRPSSRWLRVLEGIPGIDEASARTVVGLAEQLRQERLKLDRAVNNCSLSRRLDVEIHLNPGALVFGLPHAAVQEVPSLNGIQSVYFVDEFENLGEDQQRYFNTLVREREGPSTFRIGVRLYGHRTLQTLSGGELLVEDSEYEALRLDRELRDRPVSEQVEFAKRLVKRRVVEAGLVSVSEAELLDPAIAFTRDEELDLVSEGPGVSRSAPWFDQLEKRLEEAGRESVAVRANAGSSRKGIAAKLKHPDGLTERASVLLFYRAWSRGEDLNAAAEKIAASASEYARASSKSTLHSKVLQHFRQDLLAAMARELKRPYGYAGFETFVRLSGGLPRGLLTVLKYVYTWAIFRGEEPFRSARISVQAQAEGVRQAAEWFFSEARAPGAQGVAVREAMSRLGQLLRAMRFSDKPPECSLCCFSLRESALSEEGRSILRAAVSWSMLIPVEEGQVDRNSGRVDEKYQIHPMLAPRWDLPIARRGALALSAQEAKAAFEGGVEWDDLVSKRVARATAPWFGSRQLHKQELIPELELESI
jgi:hypothetical protein